MFNKILTSLTLTFSIVGTVHSAKISFDDSLVLNALYNAERCEPIYIKNGNKSKAEWAKATIDDVNKIMVKKYDRALLQVEKDSFISRTKNQDLRELIKVCSEIYEARCYLY
ncbi:hypothetical protein [Aeromonas sp. DSM 116730]|uniref:hypothetical protein n=1 Tax=Aeromonas sp. DSM 116730 TaxID=3115851 RepID=UPI00398294BA